MNTQNDLLKRLLKSYPVKVIKDHFDISGENQDEAIETIVQDNSTIEIQNFSFSHFNYTKQHIYIYKFQNPYTPAALNLSYLGHITIKQDVSANKLQIFCLVKINFTVIVSHAGAINEVDLEFHQPLMIEATKDYLIFRFTVLESKLAPYFPQNASLYSPTKIVDEKSITSEILANFIASDPQKADLNKGIKAMWEDNLIDSKEVKFKKTKSVSRETMDEDKLVKVEYPDVYAELMKSPLNKTIFKYLNNNDDLCGHFTCDATNGEVNIPLYSKNTSQVESTINEIITKN